VSLSKLDVDTQIVNMSSHVLKRHAGYHVESVSNYRDYSTEYHFLRNHFSILIIRFDRSFLRTPHKQEIIEGVMKYTYALDKIESTPADKIPLIMFEDYIKDLKNNLQRVLSSNKSPFIRYVADEIIL
jgi:hypothetical protein